jgi:hypothetical protein
MHPNLMKEEIAKVGEGIYTAADVSRIFKIPYPQAKYWFQYYVRNRLFETLGYRYYFPIKDTIAINFLSLIEIYVFFKFKEKNIKAPRIIKAHTKMAKFLHTPYPFAAEEFYIFGGEIFFGQSDSLKDTLDIEQSFISDYITPFAEKIKFDDKRLVSCQLDIV